MSYLTRQVAALDSTEKGRVGLADYYSAKGESPGQWVGSGMVGIGGLDAGDVVAAEQMKHLFGAGLHPLTGELLGARYKVYGNEGMGGFNVEVARRLERLNTAAGRPARFKASIEETAAMRSEVAREFFVREHNRGPKSARELSAALARYSRPRQTAVAGFDLTFSPVKSVSALWAVAPREVAMAIEAAHNAAVADALAFIEREVLFAREGKDGARQVETRGLVATAFTHRDSRAGDPDLHTHVAVANKVQTEDGKWLAIYGRVLHQNIVAASETYNTALEHHLVERLGVQFAERSSADRGKRPVREIEGVDRGLCDQWSRRRADIVVRQRELSREFGRAQGRPSTPVEAIALAQQANLETRDAKHEPRSLAEQREMWQAEAVEVLGSQDAIGQMIYTALNPVRRPSEQVSAAWVHTTAERVITEVEAHRATWQIWHLRAEAQRHMRDVEVPADRVAEVVEWVVDDAIELLSINLTPDLDPVAEPDVLRRSDGVSVYRHTGRDHYTSRRVLDAEQRITNAAERTDGVAIPVAEAQLSVMEAATAGVPLNDGQAALVVEMASSGRRVQLGLAAAGSGKTTAMRVLARAWTECGGNALGLAPSAAALSDATGIGCETLAKLAHDLSNDHVSVLADSIGRGTLMLVDEAGMADTLTLDRVISFAISRGASVRLIGDDQQLAAIGAGGLLRDIATTHGAVRLDEVVRFGDPTEAEATLALRDGDPSALGFYLDHDRIHVGETTTCADAVFEAWSRERADGRDCLMLAPTRDLVAELNQRARTGRLAGRTPGTEVSLADGSHASVGDTVITRLNSRRLGVSATDWVKNGDRWTITGIHDGNLAVRHTRSGLRTVLPTEYVAAHVELGYASTVHTAQGLTVDSMHGIVTGEETRQLLYTMVTRGRVENHIHILLAGDGDPHQLAFPDMTSPATATELLEGVLARDGAAVSATTIASIAARAEAQLHDAATRYADATVSGAEYLLGSEWATQLEAQAEALVPGITDTGAWTALRAHLLLTQADGRDAVRALTEAVASRSLDDAGDPAAVVLWRLVPDTSTGPLPWLPDIPRQLADDPTWGTYLNARAQRVTVLAENVRENVVTATRPMWADPIKDHLTTELLSDLAVWRAANGIDPSDRRPAGPPPTSGSVATAYFRGLIDRIHDGHGQALARWEHRITSQVGHRDDFTPEFAVRLDRLQRRGIDAEQLLGRAAGRGPLPDDHATATLWYRIFDHLGPAQRPRRADKTEIKPRPTSPRHEPPNRKPPAPGIGF